MILPRYTACRRIFADVTASTWRDGLPAWPGPFLDDGTNDMPVENVSSTSLLRIGGFSASVKVRTVGGYSFESANPIGPLLDPARIPSGDDFWPLDITCNDFVEDAVAGAHDFDWYFSRRRDPGRYMSAADPTALREIAEDDLAFSLSIPDATASGTVRLTPNLTPIGEMLPGLSGTDLLTAYAFSTIFRNVYVYVRRRSDGAIQWCSLYLES